MPAVQLVDATAPGARGCAPTTPSEVSTPGRWTFVDVLEREWGELATSAGSLATVQQWGRRHPAALAGCRTLDDILELIRADADPVLLALLESAVDGDTLAGRVVVQSMLPKLITMARRDPDHELTDYVSWMWLVLSSYPLARRRRRVAANLALDTLKLATRHRRSQEIPHQTESLTLLGSERSRSGRPVVGAASDPSDGLTAARVINRARRLGLLDDLTARVLTAVYDHGLPGKEAAAQLGMSVACVRWRCSRAVRSLAGHSADLLAA